MEQPTETPGIFRDSNGALINKDNASLVSYKKKKESFKKINRLENDMVNIKDDINHIKNMLLKLTENIGV